MFSPYGTIRNLHLLKGFDSKPRGCAMVLFARWSQAEAAAEALNGKTGQLVGQTRPLVVHFANPRRSPQGPPEPGIAPRKLFVGQVQPNTGAHRGSADPPPPRASPAISVRYGWCAHGSGV